MYEALLVVNTPSCGVPAFPTSFTRSLVVRRVHGEDGSVDEDTNSHRGEVCTEIIPRHPELSIVFNLEYEKEMADMIILVGLS